MSRRLRPLPVIAVLTFVLGGALWAMGAHTTHPSTTHAAASGSDALALASRAAGTVKVALRAPAPLAPAAGSGPTIGHQAWPLPLCVGTPAASRIIPLYDLLRVYRL